jgi:hypothetical protein
MWLWLARRPGGQRHRRDKSHCADGNRGRSGAGKRASVLRTASGCCIWLYLAMCAAYCVVMLRTCANRWSATKSKCSRCCSVRLSATASSLAATSVVANCAASLAVSPARRMRWTGRRSRSASTTAQRSPTKSNVGYIEPGAAGPWTQRHRDIVSIDCRLTDQNNSPHGRGYDASLSIPLLSSSGSPPQAWGRWSHTLPAFPAPRLASQVAQRSERRT